MSAPDAQAGAAPLHDRREEHDELARRLAVRRSVDEVRKGLVRLFLGLLATGLAARLAWDRWGTLAPGAVRKIHRGPPVLLWIAMALAVGLLALAARALLASRRLGRDEDRLYARFRRLRAELGLDR